MSCADCWTPDVAEALLSETERQWATSAIKAMDAGDLDPGVPAEVQVFRLGDVWLVTLPGEVFLEIGWKTRDAVAKVAGVAPDRVVVHAIATRGLPAHAGAHRDAGGHRNRIAEHADRPDDNRLVGVGIGKVDDVDVKIAAA